MTIEPRIMNPIVIKIGKNVIMTQKEPKEYALTPGVMFGGEYYGFILIIEKNGKQREFVYFTQCRINAVGIESGILKIFEKGKKCAWSFDKVGNLLHAPMDEFDDKFKSQAKIILENSNMFMGNPLLINPVKIVISKQPEKSSIVIEESVQYPLSPGLMLGDIHYGFILSIETNEGQKEVVYPTQNRIDAIGKEGLDEFRVFENGKYYPWIFSMSGKLKKKASYNLYSKRDLEYISDSLKMNESDSEYCFVMKKKK